MTLTAIAPAATDAVDPDALLARAANGDATAFAAFYDVTSPRIYAVVLTIVRDPASAARLLQDIYLAAWQHLRRPAMPPCPGMEWMSLLAHRHAAGRRPPQARPDAATTAGSTSIVSPPEEFAESA